MKQLDEIETLFAQLENRICAWWSYVDDDNRYLFPRADEYEQKKNDAKAIIEKRLRSTEAALTQKEEEIKQARQTGNYWKDEHNEANKKIDQLQADLDQVLGEAVGFAGIIKSTRVWAADVEQAIQFLTSPLVQSWRARQGKV